MPQDFAAALDAITRDLAARDDVAGLLFFGSAARGTATVGSDLDLYAISTADAGGHLGRRVLGVPVEVSFGSVAQWRALLGWERPAFVHAFATGRVAPLGGRLEEYDTTRPGGEEAPTPRRMPAGGGPTDARDA